MTDHDNQENSGEIPEAPGLLNPSRGGSLGDRLRTARAQQGLSIDEVAMQTKIAVPLLEAMEHDNFARVGQAVYVRGYLRKFAKALNLPDDEIVASYDAMAGIKRVDTVAAAPARETDDAPAASKAGAGLAVAGVLIVCIGILLWHLSNRPRAPVAPPVPQAAPPAETTVPESLQSEVRPAPAPEPTTTVAQQNPEPVSTKPIAPAVPSGYSAGTSPPPVPAAVSPPLPKPPGIAASPAERSAQPFPEAAPPAPTTAAERKSKAKPPLPPAVVAEQDAAPKPAPTKAEATKPESTKPEPIKPAPTKPALIKEPAASPSATPESATVASPAEQEPAAKPAPKKPAPTMATKPHTPAAPAVVAPAPAPATLERTAPIAAAPEKEPTPAASAPPPAARWPDSKWPESIPSPGGTQSAGETPPAPKSESAPKPEALTKADSAPKPEPAKSESPVKSEAATKSEAPAKPAPAAGGATLRLTFKDKSWAQVKDSRSKVLVNGLIPAGRTETLSGMPPYVITLGRAINVRIEYDGKAVDLVPYTTSHGTAYFSLPAE